MKKLTAKKLKEIHYNAEQAIANAEIEGEIITPSQKQLLIDINIKKIKGEITDEEAREILYQSTLKK